MRPLRRDPTDWRPSRQQHAVLSVAVAPPTEVADAWARSRGEIPVDALHTLDWGSRRLVPLVAWRLREAGVEDPTVGTLRSDLAASMLVARLKLASYAGVLAALEQAGLDVLVLKGAGIGPLAYPDPGTRPLSDLDVLVRCEQLARLDELVEHHGGYRSHEAIDPVLRARYRHAADARVAGRAVDVHWRLLVDRFDGRPDAAMFDRSVEIGVGGVRARTLGVEDHIVHVIAHGVRRNSLPPIRWIVDVARLVDRQPVDWSVVEEQAERRHVEAVVGRALELVHDRYAVPVPEETLTALRRAGGPTRGRLDLWSRTPKRTRVGGAVNLAVVHYVLATQGWSLPERLTRFPGYVRSRGSVTDGRGAAAEPTRQSWLG